MERDILPFLKKKYSDILPNDTTWESFIAILTAHHITVKILDNEVWITYIDKHLSEVIVYKNYSEEFNNPKRKDKDYVGKSFTEYDKMKQIYSRAVKVIRDDNKRLLKSR